MEIMDASQLNPAEFQLLIIPTVMIPLTAVSVVLTIIASFIAGLFGIKLSTEGPKRLLEVLLKPKVLLSALVLNLVILGGIKAYDYIKNLPAFIWKIESTQKTLAKPSERKFENRRQFDFMFKDVPALSAFENLKQIWNVKLPKGNFRSPVFSGGSIFIGTDDGHVYELDQLTGEILRKFFVGSYITPELTIDDSTLYVGEGTHNTHHARVYAFDLKSGDLRGHYETKGHTEGQPVIGEWNGEKSLLVVSGGDGLHSVDPTSMKVKWQVNDGHVDASVLALNGKVFSGTGRDKGNGEKFKTFANAYDFSTGKRIWQKELPASSWMTPVAWKDSACFIFGEVYFESGIGGVYCFKQSDGTPTHAYNLAEPQTGIPLVIGDSLISTSSNGKVCSLDLNSRLVSWCHEVKNKGKSFSSPSYSVKLDALVYASKSDGLWILDRKTGSVLKNLKNAEWKTIYGAAGIGGDIISVGDIDGNTSAFKIN
jgi:outer membrane protein assembly factor BamB